MKLREIATLGAGLHFRGMIEADPKGLIPVLQVKDFDERLRVDPEALTRVRPGRDVRSYQVKNGDVLFLSRGARQFAVPVRDELEGSIVPNHFFILRIRSPVVGPAFLAWYLNSPPAQTALRAMAQGSNVPFVSKRDLTELEVPVPPIETQQRIVKITALVQQEKELLASLVEARKQMVETLCLEAARGSV